MRGLEAMRCVQTLRLRVGLLAVAVAMVSCSSGDDDPDPSAPTLSFSASGGPVDPGESVTLTWSGTNVSSCTAGGAWSGSRQAEGSQVVGPLDATSTFRLTCTGSAGSVERAVTVEVRGGPGEPTVTITADPETVSPGGFAELAWDTENVESCTASGGWSGSRPTSGSEEVGPLSQSRMFRLSCTGPTGSANASVTVQVGAAPSPTLTLSASPSSVAAGGSATLTWNAANASGCTASGDWSGTKAASGSETVGPLLSDASFSLTCTGSGGSITRSAQVTVEARGGDALLSGSVDSSLVSRFGSNRVYVFAGNVTPDDVGGTGAEPLLRAPVVQAANACTFSYSIADLAPGEYTLALTGEADDDDPNADDSISFARVARVSVSGAPSVYDFEPSNVLRVGPGKPYTTVRAAASAASSGDVIEIDAGVYVDDIVVWRQNDLTLRGVGGRAHMRADSLIPYTSGSDQQNGMGIWVIRGHRVRVENIEFSGARVPDQNGAGIRAQGQDLTICNSYFHDNENGILGGAHGTMLIEYSEFANNGLGEYGRTHNIYINEGDTFIIRHSYSHHANIGHQIKTRARVNHILYNRAMDEANGNSSYAVDVPNGGLTFLIGNLLQQGPNTDNSAIVNYGTEGLSGGRTHRLYIVNNTVVNDRGAGTFFQVAGGASAEAVNNLLIGNGSVGSVTQRNNIQTNDGGLVDRYGFDYRLTSNSPARDAGIDPGQGDGVDLRPVYQYLHPAAREPRPSDGTIDVGAYELE